MEEYLSKEFLSEANLSEVKKLVAACYSVLLGREPDEAGFALYVNQFSQTPDYQWLLSAFANSMEFRNRQSALTLAAHPILAHYYYFFHIPKTAGLTVKAYLSDTLAPHRQQLFPGVFIKDLLSQIETIKRYPFFSGHFMGFLDALLGVTTHKATVLRDPVDRVISHYFHALRDPSLPLHARIQGRSMQDILHDETTRGFAVNYQAQYLAALVDDQSWFEHTLHFRAWPKSDQELLDKARAGLALMEVVGLHEELPAFFRKLAEQWPIRYLDHFPKVNAGDNRDDQLISAADRQLIREVNAVDYTLYEEVVAQQV